MLASRRHCVSSSGSDLICSIYTHSHTHTLLSDRLCTSSWVRAQWFTTDVQIERHLGDLSQFRVKNLMFNVSEARRLAASMLTLWIILITLLWCIIIGVWTHFQLYSWFYLWSIIAVEGMRHASVIFVIIILVYDDLSTLFCTSQSFSLSTSFSVSGID